MLLIPFKTLLKKEIDRFLAIWPQTVLAPVISVSLYLLIFGLSLGRQINIVPGFSYLQFIIPGLIMMGVINNASANAGFSIFIAKIDGYIVDILVAPLGYFEMAAAYILGSIARALMVGGIIFAVGLFFSFTLPVHLWFSLLVAILTAWAFSSLGAIVGIWAKKFDHLGTFSSFIMLPLIYLSGVFYSLKILPPVWRTVSKFNPLFYMTDAFRYGYLGISDTNPFISLLFIIILDLALTFALVYIFKKGWRLRS